jgi:hypothetical protein
MQLRQAPMLLVAAALATGAQAEPETVQAIVPSEPVAFEVNVCLASTPEGEVDPECRSIQSQLPVRFGTLKVQKRHKVSVTFGEPGGIELPTGSTVEFRPISIVESPSVGNRLSRIYELHMQVEMPGMVNTRLRIQSGRSLILAGQRHSDGYLVIEIKPTFNPVAPIIVDAPELPTGPRVPGPVPAEPVGSRTPAR